MTTMWPGSLASPYQQRYYAERLIDDLNLLERERNLTVNELDARTIARWLLLALPMTDLRSHEPPRTEPEPPDLTPRRP